MENVKSWSSESERNRLFGESYFLRAMAYYELAQVFGGDTGPAPQPVPKG